MTTKRKILVLVDWFAPGYKAGGPIQSCVNFAFAMRRDFDVYVLTTDTDHGEPEPYPGITAGCWTNDLAPDIHVFYLQKRSLTAQKIRGQIDAIRPDFIYLNHMFSPLFVIYPLWLKYTGRFTGQVVLCPRGALYASALAVKPWKKTPFIKLFRWMGIHKRILFHATNEREKQAILKFFPGSDVSIADNLPNMNQPAFQAYHKTTGSLKCIFVARILPLKNLLFLLDALDGVAANVLFTVVGPVEDKDYWEKCRERIASLRPNIEVGYLGPKRNDELIHLLQQAHLFVLPTTGENFGHSIFEALLAGRPVLISDQTPWLGLQRVRAGWDLPLADPRAFTRALEEAAAWDQAAFDEWAKAGWQYAHDFIDNLAFREQYNKLFE